MPVLILFLAAVAVRALVRQTREDLARWRGRHPAPARKGGSALVTAGYWGHQSLHGFPTARHGFMTGWHRARTAHHKAAAGIARAQAEHAERRLSWRAERAELSRRRDAALAGIELQREVERAHEQALADNQRIDEQLQAPVPAEEEDGTGFSWGREDRSYVAEAASLGMARQYARLTSERNHGRWAAWEGHEVRAVYEGGSEVAYNPWSAEADARADDASGRERIAAQEQAEAEQQGSPAAQSASERNGTVSETTYASVRAAMDKAAAGAEERRSDAEQSQAYTEEHLELARQARASSSTAADEMQALKVDAATLGAMAEHLDALDAAEKAAQELHDQMGLVRDAWARVEESAQQVKSQLEAGGHGALAEAHAGAAGGGAEREFYQE
jgi:hypothetical protein